MLVGESDWESELVRNCAIPRLKSILTGDEAEVGEEAGRPVLSPDSECGFVHYTVGPPLAILKPDHEFPAMTAGDYESIEELQLAILTSEGFLPVAESSVDFGVTIDGRRLAQVLRPDEFLSDAHVARFASSVGMTYDQGYLYYFRTTPDFDATRQSQVVVLKRVPMELTLWPV